MTINFARRKFIAALGAAAVVWPLAARAQQTDRVRRIGVAMSLASDDPEGHARLRALLDALQQLGWTVGRNLQIDYRWGSGDADHDSRDAAELVSLAPDVILATGNSTLKTLLLATRIVPIVFVQVTDPVGAGMVKSMVRPGGNATGFSSLDYGTSGKWLKLLKEIAPNVTRVAVLCDNTSNGGIFQWDAIDAEAPSIGVELHAFGIPDAAGIERIIDAFARNSNGGLIVTESGPSIIHRDLIIALAARYRLPAIYPLRFFVTEGGLMSYGHDTIDAYRRAAGYVDRILKGEKPADLPVQAPTKYELVVNLKTANALGLTVPSSLLSRADEVIR